MAMSLRRRFVCWFALMLFASAPGFSIADEQTFPFDRDLMLDAAPMPGSKRIPMLQFDEDGAVSIDLWCASLRGRADVGDDTITIVLGQAVPAPAQCSPERQSGDDALVAGLSQVTNWRREGDIVELRGAITLRFLLLTN